MREIVNLALNERGISCSYAFLGICEAIFRVEGRIFCVEPHIRDIKSFFNLDNLEPAPGRPAPELEVKALKIGKLDVLGKKNFRLEKLFFLPEKCIYFISYRNEHPVYTIYILYP